MEKFEYKAIENGKEIICNFFIQNDFLSHEECDQLVNYYDQSIQNHPSPDIGFFANRLIWYTHIPEFSIAKKIMQATKYNTIKLIKTFYQLNHEIYGDSIQLVSWPEGLGMPAHYDNRHPNKNEIHGTPWREYAGVIYLNDDYEGGELVISSASPPIVLKPKKGMLVVFGGGDGFMHGVRPAFGNTRYTMPCWFTSDVTKKELDSVSSY